MRINIRLKGTVYHNRLLQFCLSNGWMKLKVSVFLLEAHEVGDQSRNGAKKVMNAVAEARQWSATTTTNTTTTTTTITTTTTTTITTT